MFGHRILVENLIQSSYRLIAIRETVHWHTISYLKANCSSSSLNDPKELVDVCCILRDGTKKIVKGKIGENVMNVLRRENVEIEGACEGSCACSTCHVYIEGIYPSLPVASEAEEDMLDMAPLLRPNSRLSCQVVLTEELDNIIVVLPRVTRNFYVDGHIPKPH